MRIADQPPDRQPLAPIGTVKRRVGRDRGAAPGPQAAQEGPLGARRQPRRAVVQRRQQRQRRRVVGARLDRQRALPDHRQPLVRVEEVSDQVLPAHPREAGGSENDGVVRLRLGLPQARVDVAAQVGHGQVGAQGAQLRRAARAARPDRRA